MGRTNNDLIIIGSGAAGLMAAREAAAAGCRVLVLEGALAPGAKILMSGGGRCNVTNAVISEKDFSSECPRSVRHVIKHWGPEAAVEFFQKHGVPLKQEEGGKYFPASDSAKDVLHALLSVAHDAGVRIEYDRRVLWVRFAEGVFEISGAEFQYNSPLLLVATGGLSYPATGCDGFGYALAEQFGHKVIPTIPALTPLMTKDQAWKGLQGISTSCQLSLWVDGKKSKTCSGSLLFTHFGFSGPVVLDISRHWSAASVGQHRSLTADFLPLLKEQEWKERFEKNKRSVRTVLGELLPSRLVNLLTASAGIDGGKAYAGLGRGDRLKLQERCRRCELPIDGVMGWEKAEVTAGGVDLRELKGATLESRFQPGLFFAGEVLDADGRVGGFNLHWAWASGVAAARGALRKVDGSVTL